MPEATGAGRLAAARVKLEAEGWPSADKNSRVSLAAPGDYVNILRIIPTDDRILVTVSAPCAKP